MVMIARVNIRQFHEIICDIFVNFIQSTLFRTCSSTCIDTFVTRSSNIIKRNQDNVDIVNKKIRGRFIDKLYEINQFSVSPRTASCTYTKYRAVVLKIRYWSVMENTYEVGKYEKRRRFYYAIEYRLYPYYRQDLRVF